MDAEQLTAAFAEMILWGTPSCDLGEVFEGDLVDVRHPEPNKIRFRDATGLFVDVTVEVRDMSPAEHDQATKDFRSNLDRGIDYTVEGF